MTSSKLYIVMILLILTVQISSKDFEMKDGLIKSKFFEYPEYRLGQRFLEVLKSDPTHVFERDVKLDLNRNFNYALHMSLKLANYLSSVTNIGGSDIISIYSDDHLELVTPMLASIYLGIAFNFWETTLTEDQIFYRLNLIKPKATFTLASKLPHLEKSISKANITTTVILLDNLQDTLKNQSISEEVVTDIVDSSTRALILFTPEEMENGHPRAVVHSYDSLVENFLSSYYKPSFNDRVLHYFDSGWGPCSILQRLMRKDFRLIYNDFYSDNVVEVLSSNEIEEIVLSSERLIRASYMGLLTNFTNLRGLGALKSIYIVGSRMNYGLLREFRNPLPAVNIKVCYSKVELGEWISCQAEKPIDPFDTVGRLFPFHLIDVDPNTNEITVKKSRMMTEYYGNELATREAFDEYGWFRTNDIGYKDFDDRIFIWSRVKDVIDYHGQRIYPYKLEHFVEGDIRILYSVVVTLRRSDGKQWLVIYVVKKPGVELTKRDLIIRIRREPEYRTFCVLIKFLDLDELKFFPSGMIDRSELQERANKIFLK